MSFENVYIVAVSVLLAILVGYRWGKNKGFDEGYEQAKFDFEDQGDFLNKADRDMFYKE